MLTYDLAVSSLDASFTGIGNIAANLDHTITSVGFTDVPVSSIGTFRSGITGNRIHDGFYGPGETENVGDFEQRRIVGSFGAKR